MKVFPWACRLSAVATVRDLCLDAAEVIEGAARLAISH